MSTTEAIRIGTATTGRLITAAALVLAVVAGAFVFSDLVMMKYLAFGLLIALLLDATVVRMFLVPAIMKLLGDDCWWAPKWMKRLQNQLGLGEIYLPDERKAAALPEPADVLVGAGAQNPVRRVLAPTAVTEPAGAPINDAPTARFATANGSAEDRDVSSWLGQLRGKTSRHSSGTVEPSSAAPTHVIVDPVADDATTMIPTQAAQIAADETRAIPVSRPTGGDSDVATENLNARGTQSVSAQELLRREGRT
jgi:RND superfamily putative drug exporter